MPKITQLGFTSGHPLEGRAVDLGALGRSGEVTQPRDPGRSQDSRHKVSGGAQESWSL